MRQLWEYRVLLAWREQNQFVASDAAEELTDQAHRKLLAVWLQELGLAGFEVVTTVPTLAQLGGPASHEQVPRVLYTLKRELLPAD